jgi:hypothetical protein
MVFCSFTFSCYEFPLLSQRLAPFPFVFFCLTSFSSPKFILLSPSLNSSFLMSFSSPKFLFLFAFFEFLSPCVFFLS